MLEPVQPVIDEVKIERLLSRGVENIYPTKEKLREALMSGKRLRLYNGIDPTAPFLHIGHAMQLRKLREFQELGHEVIMLIGSFTAMIGDPTDKLATRKQLTRAEILANAKTYKKQASKILKFTGPNAAKLMFNDKWLAKMSFADVVDLASHFTVQQMMERDMFEKRFYGQVICATCNERYTAKSIKMAFVNPAGGLIAGFKENEPMGFITDSLLNAERCPKCKKTVAESIDVHLKPGVALSDEKYIKWRKFIQTNIIKPAPISLHEFMYPLMQGYDSVAMDVDLEVGGNDQTFNMLAGRTLLREMKQKEKFVLAISLLTNSEGKKMSKSEGGVIALTDTPEDMFGKIMSMDDSMIVPYFRLATDATDDQIEAVTKQLADEVNPRDIKMSLAELVTSMYHSGAKAKAAKKHFVGVFQKKESPQVMEEHYLSEPSILADLLVKTKLAGSKNEARRLVEQGGITLDDVKLTDPFQVLRSGTRGVLRRGKRQFVRLIVLAGDC